LVNTEHVAAENSTCREHEQLHVSSPVKGYTTRSI